MDGSEKLCNLVLVSWLKRFWDPLIMYDRAGYDKWDDNFSYVHVDYHQHCDRNYVTLNYHTQIINLSDHPCITRNSRISKWIVNERHRVQLRFCTQSQIEFLQLLLP